MDERFQIHYEITVSEPDTIENALETICLEQTVEMPADAISDEIRENIAGSVIRLSPSKNLISTRPSSIFRSATRVEKSRCCLISSSATFH